MKSKGKDQPALTIQFEDIHFNLLIEKEVATSDTSTRQLKGMLETTTVSSNFGV